MSPPRVSKLLDELVRAGAAPGASVALSAPGQRIATSSGVASTATGAPLGPGSRFQIGCITKLLTSLVSLELANAGRLDLDAPIGLHLPELHDHELGEELSPRHLLSHTSGYRGVNIADVGIRFYYDWSKFIRLLRAAEPRFIPGKVFDYEHTECVLLGKIVERVSGERIHDIYEKMIWAPLGIRCGHIQEDASDADILVCDHSFDANANRYVPLRTLAHCAFWDASLSDLTVSLADLVTLGEAAAGFTREPIFSDSTIRMLREPQVALPQTIGGDLHERTPSAFGLGCAQYGPSVFGHNGSARGQTCALRFELSSGTVLAVGLGCWRPHVRDLVCGRLLATICGRPEEGPARAGVAWNFNELAGCYLGAHGTRVEVSAAGGQLALDIFNSSAPSPTRLCLVRREDGTINLLSPASHLTVGFFDAPGSGRRALMLGLNAYCRVDRA